MIIWFRFDFFVIEVEGNIVVSLPYEEVSDLLPPDWERYRNESHAFHFHQDETSGLWVKGSK